MLERLARQGFSDVKQTHLRVFRNIDYDGTRASEIAARVMVTKGAISQMLAECERLGYVLASTDEMDARAKVVKFTLKGRKLVQACRKVIAEVELDFEATIGARDYDQLKKLMMKVRSSLKAS